MFTGIAFVLFVVSLGPFAAAPQPTSQPQPTPSASAAQPQHEDDALAETTPVVTHHQMTVNGKPLKYTATAGRLALKPESGPAEAAIFFTAYTLDGEETRTRPLTFAFNGGPGTATAWLHMGARSQKDQTGKRWRSSGTALPDRGKSGNHSGPHRSGLY